MLTKRLKRLSKQYVLCKAWIFRKPIRLHLMDILESDGVDLPKNVRDADILTQYAVQSRYPSIMEEISRSEYRDALKLAAQVVFWAEAIIK
jgi:hypothetical protein